MKIFMVVIVCSILGGCQFIGTILTGTRKVATMAMDDRSWDDDINDTKINLALRDSYIAYDPKLGLDVEPTVFEGAVLLTGALPNVDMIQKVVELTWQNPGVCKVYNYIRVAKPPTLEIVNQDAAISGKIRTELIFTKGISASNYKLTMENGTVYMMGIAQNPEELDRVISVIKNTVGVQKVVPLVRFI